MKKAYDLGEDVAGPDNNEYVRELPPDETVVVAWGTTFMKEDFVRKRVWGTLKMLDRKLYCLSKTKNGHPGHPVMLGYGPLVEF